jgi:transcription factor TFIIIB component B''
MAWSVEATAKFYRALAQFGTDFTMLAQMFPSRQRRHIKLKFNREERAHPDLIKRALMNRLPIDEAEFLQHMKRSQDAEQQRGSSQQNQ